MKIGVLLLIKPGISLAQTLTDYSIGLKTLILSSDPALAELPEWMVKSFGATYDIFSLTEHVSVVYPDGRLGSNLTYVGYDDLELFDSVTMYPKYNSIIQTSATLGYETLDANYQSIWVGDGFGALGATIRSYCATYGVRRVLLNSNPYDLNLAFVSGVEGRQSDSNTRVSFVEGPLATEIHNHIRLDASFSVGQEHEFAGNTYWISPAYINSTANVNDLVIPLLNIDYSEGGATTRGIGAVIHQDPVYKTEDMVFFFTTNVYGLCGQTLAHMWYPWVTRGLFLGQRRVILDTQVDDFFLDTSTYNTTFNRQATDNEYEPIFGFRVTADDVYHHVSLLAQLREMLPAGSNFSIQLAFNGKGFHEFGVTPEYTPNGNPASVANLDNFLWVTHTYNHIDMYCVESKCAPASTFVDAQLSTCHDWMNQPCTYSEGEPIYPASGFTPYAYILYELTRNQHFAYTALNMTAHLQVWSHRSIVTPRISGLNYTESIRAMLKAGIRTAVGDNSRDDLIPSNPWQTFHAKAKAGLNGVLLSETERLVFEDEMLAAFGAKSVDVIPRFATRVYFDVSLPEEMAMEFNSFYGPNCYGSQMEGTIVSGGLKCNISSFKYPRDLEYKEIMAMEGVETARNLLSMRSDPYMFHQANMRKFQEGDIAKSLLQDWIHSAINWVSKYTTFPIITYKMDDLATYYHQREQRDACDVRALLSYVGGKPYSLTLTSVQNCIAKLTHSATSGSLLTMPDVGQGDIYGAYDTTFDIYLEYTGSTIIPLGQL
eukprot:CFRG6683T1